VPSELTQNPRQIPVEIRAVREEFHSAPKCHLGSFPFALRCQRSTLVVPRISQVWSQFRDASQRRGRRGKVSLLHARHAEPKPALDARIVASHQLAIDLFRVGKPSRLLQGAPNCQNLARRVQISHRKFPR
jgi:hypothetical protein